MLLATIVLGDALRLLVAAPFGTTTMAAAASLVVGMLALSHTVLTNWFEVVLDAAMIAGCSLLITFGALVLVVPDALADPVATDLIAVLVTGWAIYVVWAMCDALPELQSVPRLVAFMGCAVLHWLGWVVVALDSSTPFAWRRGCRRWRSRRPTWPEACSPCSWPVLPSRSRSGRRVRARHSCPTS